MAQGHSDVRQETINREAIDRREGQARCGQGQMPAGFVWWRVGVSVVPYRIPYVPPPGWLKATVVVLTINVVNHGVRSRICHQEGLPSSWSCPICNESHSKRSAGTSVIMTGKAMLHLRGIDIPLGPTFVLGPSSPQTGPKLPAQLNKLFGCIPKTKGEVS